MQADQVVYTYFRFYTDTALIESGLSSFCTEFYSMSATGYNYKEYKCYTHNVGGLDTWVGDHGGYIALTRETGFLDGSPSDGIFDQTMLMGACRLTLEKLNILLLNGFKEDTIMLFRKVSAIDSGTSHKVDLRFGGLQCIDHPVAYTLDTTQVEKVKQVLSGCTNNSTVTEFKAVVDISAPIAVLETYINDNVTVTNPQNMFDGDTSTFTTLEAALGGYSSMYYDCGRVMSNMAIYFHNYKGGAFYNTTYVYHSLNGTDWTLLDNAPNDDDAYYCFADRGLEYRYIRLFMHTHTSSTSYKSRVSVYELITS